MRGVPSPVRVRVFSTLICVRQCRPAKTARTPWERPRASVRSKRHLVSRALTPHYSQYSLSLNSQSHNSLSSLVSVFPLVSDVSVALCAVCSPLLALTAPLYGYALPRESWKGVLSRRAVPGARVSDRQDTTQKINILSFALASETRDSHHPYTGEMGVRLALANPVCTG